MLSVGPEVAFCLLRVMLNLAVITVRLQVVQATLQLLSVRLRSAAMPVYVDELPARWRSLDHPVPGRVNKGGPMPDLWGPLRGCWYLLCWSMGVS